MTVGIYALYWEEQDLIYIGQSVNIEKRYKDHLYSLSINKHTNYKVQNAYNLYNTPILCIIQVCDIAELNLLEIFWTKEFNSINNGLNIIEAGVSGGYGINHSGSKYSRIKILKVFRYNYLSCYAHLTAKQVADILEVNEYLVSNIRAGTKHVWLSERYPYQYSLMKTIDRSINIGKGSNIKNLNTSGHTLISPEGNLVHIVNISRFARDNNLHQGAISNVVNGKANHHKGWKLA